MVLVHRVLRRFHWICRLCRPCRLCWLHFSRPARRRNAAEAPTELRCPTMCPRRACGAVCRRSGRCSIRGTGKGVVSAFTGDHCISLVNDKPDRVGSSVSVLEAMEALRSSQKNPSRVVARRRRTAASIGLQHRHCGPFWKHTQSLKTVPGNQDVVGIACVLTAKASARTTPLKSSPSRTEDHHQRRRSCVSAPPAQSRRARRAAQPCCIGTPHYDAFHRRCC